MCGNQGSCELGKSFLSTGEQRQLDAQNDDSEITPQVGAKSSLQSIFMIPWGLCHMNGRY